MKNTMTLPFLIAFLMIGCGKKNEQPIAEITQTSDHPHSQVANPPAAQQEVLLERAYNLIDNTTPSRLVCEDMLRNFIDQASGRAKAIRGQAERIKQLCGKTPAAQGETSVVIECREVSGGDYVPQAIAKTKYRCQ